MSNMAKNKSKAEYVRTRAEMNKSKAIFKFFMICLVTGIGLFLCFASFRVPFTDQTYKGFMGAIESKMGIDLRGGVLAVFDTEGDPTPSQIDATAQRLEKLLNNQGYVEATVVRQGTKIRVEVPGMQDANDIFTAIGTPADLTMRRANSDGTDGPTFLTGEHIKSVEYYQDQDYKHGIKLTFTDRGGNLFRDEIQAAEVNVTKIRIYIGDEMVSEPVVSSKDAGLDNTTVITGNFDEKSAKSFRLQIESGLYEAKLTPAETSNIPATLGKGALTAGIIAVVVALAFIFLLMWIRYGDLGLLSNLSMIIFTILFLLSLAVIGSVQLTLPGIAGIILSIGMAVDANIIIFERIRDEFKSGKRMGVAIQSGFNKSTTTILDANITTIIAAAVLFFIGTGTIMSFAITLFLGIAISMFCSLVITRSFAKLYLYINGNNERRLRLKKDEAAEQRVQAATAARNKPRALNLGGGK